MEDENKQRNKKCVISALMSVVFLGLLYGSGPNSDVDPFDTHPTTTFGIDGMPVAFAYDYGTAGGSHTLPQDTVTQTTVEAPLAEETVGGEGMNFGRISLILGAMAIAFLAIRTIVK